MRRVGKGGARCRQGAQGHGQDLPAAHHDVLVAGPIGVDEGTMFLGEVGPRLERLDHMAVGIDHRGGYVPYVAHAPPGVSPLCLLVFGPAVS